MSWFSRQMEDIGRVVTDAVTPTMVDRYKDDKLRDRTVGFINEHNKELRDTYKVDAPDYVEEKRRPVIDLFGKNPQGPAKPRASYGDLVAESHRTAKLLMEEDLKKFREDNAHLAPTDKEAARRLRYGAKVDLGEDYIPEENRSLVDDQVAKVFGTGFYKGMSRDALLGAPEASYLRQAQANSEIAKALFTPQAPLPKKEEGQRLSSKDPRSFSMKEYVASRAQKDRMDSWKSRLVKLSEARDMEVWADKEAAAKTASGAKGQKRTEERKRAYAELFADLGTRVADSTTEGAPEDDEKVTPRLIEAARAGNLEKERKNIRREKAFASIYREKFGELEQKTARDNILQGQTSQRLDDLISEQRAREPIPLDQQTNDTLDSLLSGGSGVVEPARLPWTGPSLF